MSAVAYVVLSEQGQAVSLHARLAAAQSIASRIGGQVRERAIVPGERVHIMWQGWPKRAVVVSGAGSKIEVRFPVAGGLVVKSISVEKVQP